VATEYLSKSYHPASGLLATGVALYSCYLLIEIVKRLRAAQERELAIGWIVGGAMCVGTGFWASHFVGLLSLHLPIEVGYNTVLTFASWWPGVVVMGITIMGLGRKGLSLRRRLLNALILTAGLVLMHYMGLASMGLHTNIDWDLSTVAMAAPIVFGGLAAGSLLIRHALDKGQRMSLGQVLLCAVPCAMAVRGVQYGTIEAAHFPQNSQYLVNGQLSGEALLGLVTAATVLLFAVTQMALWLEQRMRLREEKLTHTLKNAHSALKDSAHRNPLTGLHNRRGFERQLNQALELNPSSKTDLVVLFINLDGFKMVNGSLGHLQGDTLLKQAASRLSDLIRREDLVAHVAADEFVMLFRGRIDQAAAQALALRVSLALAKPFHLGSHEITLSSSIGIAPARTAETASEWISHAETAMRSAKMAGGGSICVFEEGMLHAGADQLDLQRDLRQAIEHSELLLFYQPKRHAQSGLCSGAEALLRWRHATRGMVSPGEFIPLAERFGLIIPLGSWVIDEACRQVQTWHQQGLDMQVAVNLSVHQLRQPDLAEHIREAIARHGIEPRRLIFEITESVAMENVAASLKVFEQLASIGVQLSIDDFGTGYSSLSYLSKLPASQLKIDRSFVKELGTSSNALAIVEAVVHLAHALKLQVVAEGVETQTQHEALLALGCDELQGFLFAKPMPPADLARWLQAQPTAAPPQAPPELPPATPATLAPPESAQAADTLPHAPQSSGLAELH
jgi:diguanylate cyclase